MIKKTFIFSVLLILLGITSYFGTGRTSMTALIPTFFGGTLFVLGILALSPRMEKHAMHCTVVVALVGFIGTVKGALKCILLLTGEMVERPTAVKAQGMMAVLCLIYVILCFRWFLNNRRKKIPPMLGV